MSDKTPISIDQGVEFLKQLRRETKRAGVSGDAFQKALEDKATREAITSSAIAVITGKTARKQRVQQGAPHERYRIESFTEFLKRWENVQTIQEAMGLLDALGDYCPTDLPWIVPIHAKSHEDYGEKIGRELLKRFQFLRQVAATDSNLGIRERARKIMWEKFILMSNGGHLHRATPKEVALKEVLGFIEGENLRYSDNSYPWIEHITEFCLTMAQACKSLGWYERWQKIVLQNLERFIKLSARCKVPAITDSWSADARNGVTLLKNWRFLKDEDFDESPAGRSDDSIRNLRRPIKFRDSSVLTRALVQYFTDQLMKDDK